MYIFTCVLLLFIYLLFIIYYILFIFFIFLRFSFLSQGAGAAGGRPEWPRWRAEVASPTRIALALLVFAIGSPPRLQGRLGQRPLLASAKLFRRPNGPRSRCRLQPGTKPAPARGG